MRAGHNQYAPMPGLPALQQAVADHQKRFYGLDVRPRQRDHDPRRRHRGAVRHDRGAPRPRRRGDRLRALLRRLPARDRARAGEGARRAARPARSSGSTRGARGGGLRRRRGSCVLNSPSNPAGRVFTRAELEAIAGVVRASTTCWSSPTRCTSTSSSRARTCRSPRCPGCASARSRSRPPGKTFSLTGWKVGWACAAPALAAAVRAVHQFVTFAVATPFQHAVAAALATRPTSTTRALRGRLPDAAATACATGSQAAGFGVAGPRAPTSRSPTCGRSASTTTETFCRTLVERWASPRSR